MRNSVEVTFTDSSGSTVNYVFDKNNASNEAAKGTNGCLLYTSDAADDMQ